MTLTLKTACIQRVSINTHPIEIEYVLNIFQTPVLGMDDILIEEIKFILIPESRKIPTHPIKNNKMFFKNLSNGCLHVLLFYFVAVTLFT